LTTVGGFWRSGAAKRLSPSERTDVDAAVRGRLMRARCAPGYADTTAELHALLHLLEEIQRWTERLGQPECPS
jgi:hypothetical protein